MIQITGSFSVIVHRTVLLDIFHTSTFLSFIHDHNPFLDTKYEALPPSGEFVGTRLIASALTRRYATPDAIKRVPTNSPSDSPRKTESQIRKALDKNRRPRYAFNILNK